MVTSVFWYGSVNTFLWLLFTFDMSVLYFVRIIDYMNLFNM